MAGRRRVMVGVDTHSAQHCAAVLDRAGRLVATGDFDACARGYRTLLGWVRTFGVVEAAGVEGTGAYGAGPGPVPGGGGRDGPRGVTTRPPDPPQPRQVRSHRR